MNIRQTFIDLTKKTYPHGTEHLLEPFLPDGISKDKYGNYYFIIGEDPRVIFASHLDTVSSEHIDVTHEYKNVEKTIIGTDGSTTLGADCKAGVVAMLYMIEKNVPGFYYFFIGEEVGCIGSNKASSNIDIFNHNNFDKVISFDRRGNSSIITHQGGKRCCSNSFTEDLILEFANNGIEMNKDDTGVATDSKEFMTQISECTNISVGYLNEHTGEETQDLAFLEDLCEACINIDWETLSTARDHTAIEYKKYKRVDEGEYAFSGGHYKDYWDGFGFEEEEEEEDSYIGCSILETGKFKRNKFSIKIKPGMFDGVISNTDKEKLKDMFKFK